ncbi:MAG: DUF1934 domain-containing protein [Clostridiales bacterium]|jgi:uncharacterized beta-barrel protein YwiB (DUF1934 family)|nr:DUF1934 domain-containing protein [Clostridiales bacterium]
MKRNVVIKITNIQSEGGHSENHEVTTKGTFSGDENDYTLEYVELFDERTKCNTTVRVVNKKTVTIVRVGDFNSEFIIEQNNRHNCHYETPYGEFMLGIYAKSVESVMTEKGGTLRMSYTIDFYAGLASENEMTIEFSVI